jgi:hypothetical protein
VVVRLFDRPLGGRHAGRGVHRLQGQAWIDEWGTPGSDQLRLTERIRRPTFGTLEIQMTVNDPKTFTKSFSFTVQQRLMPDTELIEFVCGENNTAATRLVGH